MKTRPWKPWVRQLTQSGLLLLHLLFFALPAAADPAPPAFARLQSADFETIHQAITEIASSGHPRALTVLEGLESGELVFDEKGQLFLKEGSAPSPVLEGASREPHGKLSPVAVNNRVRRALGPLVSGLRLRSPDRAIRKAAAEELSKRPQKESRAALLDTLQQEKDSTIRALLEIGLARIDLHSEEDTERYHALLTIKKQADLSFKPELEAMLQRSGVEGAPPLPPEIRKLARSALTAIENKLVVINLIANTFYGLSLGSVLLLAALGLAITFGLMHVINMAHGEMLMIGAYSTYVVQTLFQSHLPGALDWYLVVAVPLAFLVCGLVGMGLEHFVVRHLYGRPLETLLATWGISLMLIQTIRLIFGAQNVTVANPSWLSGGLTLMPNLVLPYSRLAIIAFTAFIVLVIAVLLLRTSFGLQIRAVTQNRAMAASMGIRAKRVDRLTFGLGSGLAGLGGVAISQLGNVGPELGQGYIVDSFMVVVLGGVGKLIGTVLGAMGLGLLNKYFEPAFGAVLGKILILVFIVLFLQKRPQGLFALKGRAAEVVG